MQRSGASLLFRHADGSAYGQSVTPQVIDAIAKVFSALRNLGFKEKEIHAVLAELRRQGDLRDAPIEHLLREALQRLAPPRGGTVHCRRMGGQEREQCARIEQPSGISMSHLTPR